MKKATFHAIAGLLALGLAVGSNFAQAQAGTLDTTFGTGGTVTANLGVNYSFSQNLTGSIFYSFWYQPNGFGGTAGRSGDVVVNQLTFQLSKTF